jgi:hypothetical protein
MATYRARFSMVGIFVLGVAAGALSLTAFQRGAGPVARAQSAGCTDASFQGTYGVLAQGYSLTAADGSTLDAPIPRAAVLVVTVDGAGTVSIGGFMNPNPPTGSYAVNPDCSFTLTIAAPNGMNIGSGSAKALGVLVDGGRRFYVASTDPNNAQYFLGERQ